MTQNNEEVNPNVGVSAISLNLGRCKLISMNGKMPVVDGEVTDLEFTRLTASMQLIFRVLACMLRDCVPMLYIFVSSLVSLCNGECVSIKRNITLAVCVKNMSICKS